MLASKSSYARLGVVSILLFLSGQTPVAAGLFGDLLKPADKPVVLDEKSDPKQILASAVKEKDPALSIRGDRLKRVGISALQITFVTDSSLSQTKKRIGIGTSGEARANVNYKLEAPSPAVYQAVVDRMRVDLEKAIAARGYEVISPDALMADSEFAAKVANTPQARSNDPGFFSGRGDIIVNAKGTADTFGVMQGVAEMKLAERLGAGVGLIKVQLQVNFAALEEMGFADRALSGADAGVKHKIGLSVDSNGQSNSPSQLTLSTSLGGWPRPLLSTIYLPNPIAKDVKQLGESKTDAAIGFLKSLAGGSSTGASYVVTPADDYAEQLGGGLSLVAKVLAEALPAP